MMNTRAAMDGVSIISSLLSDAVRVAALVGGGVMVERGTGSCVGANAGSSVGSSVG